LPAIIDCGLALFVQFWVMLAAADAQRLPEIGGPMLADVKRISRRSPPPEPVKVPVVGL